MNKRKSISVNCDMSRYCFPVLAVCFVSFMFGAVAGTALSSGFADGEVSLEFLSGYVETLRSGVAQEKTLPLFLGLSWYHILVFLLGFTMPGFIAVPVVSAIRGFTLSFAMATFVRVYSASGAVAGSLLIGLPALLTIPIFFPLAAEAMRASYELLLIVLHRQPPAGRGVYTTEYFVRFLAAFIFLLLISLGERALLSSGILELPIFP